MSRKTRKRRKKVVSLRATYPIGVPTHCGFPLVVRNTNQLWKWDTLENVNF